MTKEELLEIEERSSIEAIGIIYDSVIADDMRKLIAEVKMLKKGEYICIRCGIRKNADPIEADF